MYNNSYSNMPFYGNYPNPYNMQMQQNMQPYQNQQIMQQSGLVGRVVNSLEEITANDVPMNNAAYFPKSDKQEIYLKAWNANGTISTLVYKLVSAEGQGPEQQVNNMQLYKYLEDMQKNILEIKEQLHPLHPDQKEQGAAE